MLAFLQCTIAVPSSEPTPTPNLSNAHSRKGNCKHTVFTVRATATNTVIQSPSPLILSTQQGVNTFFGYLPGLLAANETQTRSGTYTLAAEYCHAIPDSKSSPAPLQILLHGSACYTKEYWSHGTWGNASLKYSWTYAMNRAGYSTLAVDKLGNGESSHPDPVNDVQLPLQMETVHSLIMLIKSGKADGIPAPPNGGLIYVGHSSGSLLGAALAQKYPSDVDAVVLTGYPPGGSNNKGGISSFEFLPAALSRPEQFPADLNYGYLRMNSEVNRTGLLYYKGHFEPAIAHLDYETQDAQPIGEGFRFGPTTQPAFKGKVLVVTGTKDAAICGYTPVEECVFNKTILTAVGKSFSSNSGFNWLAPVSGHAVNWHYSAPATYRAVVLMLRKLLGNAAPRVRPRG